MAKLVYTAITSLDGYVADSAGNFDWSVPDDEVHSFVNNLERDVGTYLLGRRMYEVLSAWETLDTEGYAVAADYASIWLNADKVVYSTTLDRVSTLRTRIAQDFDADEVRALVAAADRTVSVGGPTLAAQAIDAGLVDELHQFVSPVVVGGGVNWLPVGANVELELIDERRFRNGVVHVHYRVQR